MSTVKHAVDTNKLIGDMAIIFDEIKSLGMYTNLDLLQYVTIVDLPKQSLAVEIYLGENRKSIIEFDNANQIKTIIFYEGITQIDVPFKTKELIVATFGYVLATLSQYAVYQSLFKGALDTIKTEKVSRDMVDLINRINVETKKPPTTTSKIKVVNPRVH